VDALRQIPSKHGFDYDKAISDFSEAIRLDPNNAQAYGHRAAIYRIQGKNFEADVDFARAKQLGYTGPE
jgi:Flp pilus assembly protein TadD